MVPEQELDEWLERLWAREDVAAACPNWCISLEGPRRAAPSGVDLIPAGVAAFLEAQGMEPPPPGAGDGAHVVVIDSGVSTAAVCCERLAAPQLDYAGRSAASSWRRLTNTATAASSRL
jgi:hypothetical protein